MLKAMFPACASFGPLFMVMGFLMPNRGEGLPIGFFLAFPGALMTSAALNALYRSLHLQERSACAIPQTVETKVPGPV